MFEEREVKEFFEMLDLDTKEKREKILDQGKVNPEPEKEHTFQIALDNVTSVEKDQ